MRKRRLLLAVIVPALLLVFVGTGCGWSKPEAGEIGVQRGAGPTEGKKFKDILCPGSGASFTGNDTVHYYPHSGVQRYYPLTVKAQTSDGFFVTVTGNLLFNTTFDCSDLGRARARAFDEKFGVRKFAELGGKDQNGLFPYDGDRGWGAFLDTVGRPIFVNEVVRVMQQFRCREMIASCVLVSGDGTKQEVGTARIDYTAIQTRVAEGMSKQMTDTLGGQFLTGWQFTIVQPKLEEEVQAGISRAQAAFANVSVQTAANQAADQQAQAAKKLAVVYEQSPALAEIEMLRILCGTNTNRTARGTAAGSGCNEANVYLGINPTVVASGR